MLAAGFLGNLAFTRGIFILYLLRHGYSLPVVGLLQTLQTTLMVVLDLPAGILADRWGRKRTLVLGHLVWAGSYVCFLFPNNSALVVLAFICLGTGIATTTGANTALLCEAASTTRQNSCELHTTKLLGRFYAAGTAALTLALLVGGSLADIHFWIPFVAGALVQTACAGVFLLCEEFRAPNHQNTQTLRSHIGELAAFLKIEPRTRYLIIGIAILNGAISVTYLFAQEILVGFGLTLAMVSAFYALEALLTTGMNAQTYRVQRFLGRPRALLFGALFASVCFLALGTNVGIVVVVGFVLLGLADCIVHPIGESLLSDRISPAQLTTGFSVVSVLSSFVMALMSPLLGLLAKPIGLGAACAIFGFIITVIAITCLKLGASDPVSATAASESPASS